MLNAFGEMGERGVTAEELAAAKEQLKGEIMLGLESTSGRMTRLGRGELTLGRVLSPDEVIDRIHAVSTEQIERLVRGLFLQEPRVLSAVGPLSQPAMLAKYGFQEVRHG